MGTNKEQPWVDCSGAVLLTDELKLLVSSSEDDFRVTAVLNLPLEYFCII